MRVTNFSVALIMGGAGIGLVAGCTPSSFGLYLIWAGFIWALDGVGPWV